MFDHPKVYMWCICPTQSSVQHILFFLRGVGDESESCVSTNHDTSRLSFIIFKLSTDKAKSLLKLNLYLKKPADV